MLVKLLERAKSSIAKITGKTLNVRRKKTFKEWSTETDSSKLNELSIQSKALEVMELEEVNQVWKGVLQGLPRADVLSHES